MTIPNNIFSNTEMQSNFQDFSWLYEKRMINSAEGKILYVAVTVIPNATLSDPVWDVRKMSYDANGFMDRFQMPDNGPGLKYTVDDIATYFS